MANAFIPDDKRRHQYFPVNEDPPDYDVASGRSSEAGPSTNVRPPRTRRRPSASNRRPETEASPESDELDALDEGSGHHAEPHRANSDESTVRDFEELDIELEPSKDPIHIRLSREIQRITARMDKVLYTYVNATLMRYIYGIILGAIVIVLIYAFGGSMPKLVVPKRYKEDALRAYINEETSSANIRKYTEEAASIFSKHHSVEALFDSSNMVNWVHDEFVKLGVARNAMDKFNVYYPRPTPGGQALEIRSQDGSAYAASLVDDHGRLHSYITHGASGNLTAPLTYGNYATNDDFSWLADSGVTVQGSIVIFKRDPAVDLSVQVNVAAASGALACIVYSSPVDYGSARGQVFPDGPYMPADASSSGDVALTWIQPGDVLTPGYPSTKSAKVVNPLECPALVRIPVIPISAEEAEIFLGFLQNVGPQVSSEWPLDNPGQIYYAGGVVENAPEVLFTNFNTEEIKHKITNVLSELEGIESDQVLVVGTSLSSLSSMGVMMEVVRIFADLTTKYAWKPRRSIIFAAWDKSEQNLMGSTEWTEAQLKSLRHQGIAYINLGQAASLSSDISVRATPSLSKAILQAMTYVQNRFGNATVAEDQELSTLSSTAEPTGFSDSIAFEAHAGNAVADIGFPNSNLFSGCLESAQCINDHIDPDFTNHLVLAKTFAMTILELVDERFIPLDVHAFARAIEAGVRKLSTKHPNLNFGGNLNKVMQEFDYRTHAAMEFIGEWEKQYREDNEIEAPVLNLRRSNWNYAVASFHRNLLRSHAWTTWFEHPIYGPSRAVNDKNERNWLFPHIEDAVANHDMARAQETIDMLGQTLLEAAQNIQF